MKKIFLVLCILFGWFHAVLADQIEDNRWRMYLAYQDVTQLASSGNRLFGLYNGNLMSYQLDDQTVSFYEKSNGLSEKGIQLMDYSEQEQCLVLVYDNKNVDFLYDDGTLVNIPQIKNYIDGEINPVSLTVNEEWAVIATKEGVIVLNIPQAEVKGYYPIAQHVKKAAVADKQVYALIGYDLYRGNLQDNLYDFSQWVKASDVPTNDILPCGKGLYQLVASVEGLDPTLLGAFYLQTPVGKEKNPGVKATNIWVVRGAKANGRVFLMSPNHLVYFDGAEPAKMQGFVNMPADHPYLTSTADGTYWFADYQQQLHRYQIDAEGKQLKEIDVEIGKYGPRRDLCYKLQFVGDRLLVAGGRMDYAGGKDSPATAMYLEGEKWTFMPDTGFKLYKDARYRNVLSMAQHPSDPSDMYLSCMAGVLHFKDGQFVEQFHLDNSPLRAAQGLEGNPNYVIVDGLCFDAQGNLWMTNYQADQALHVLKKDGSWKSFQNFQFKNLPTPETILIGKNGLVWANSKRTTEKGPSGLFCLDTDGTLDDESDDRSLFRSSAPNQDGTMCELFQLQAMCEDLNGQIWIGCANGVYAVTRPERWFSHDDFRIYQPKVPRNDGTNLADYLLTGINISAIAVDAGNRKWIGTFGSGIYVVSPDGSEVLNHITMDNSLLLSDNIYNMAFHPSTGELMIGTDVGLCSYQSHVTPARPTMDKNSVKVYPNPVRPDYHGKVVIEGLTDGAEVKIVTTGSQLVARGSAVGGSYEWDVCNMMNGRRVAPGVYYVLAASVNGGGQVAAKIVVI